MFDLLFGWRKASKCKKLIRNVQCRLKLLKNKRCCIVKQLRGDVAQLLKHGHQLAAFDRVEQIFKDESMVEIYDLLDNYCEFVIINLPYIRKHKDFPNDINEAVSTLIFSSARFGELPELLTIRKLFGERYGQRFVMTALELLPGNLVNLQIRESIYMKDVPDDVKYMLLDEIASSIVEPGPLLLEYRPCFEEQKAIKSSMSQISSGDAADEGKTVHVDLACESMKSSEDPCCNGLTKEHNLQIVMHKNVEPSESCEVFKFQIYGDEPLLLGEDLASETSAQLPEEMIHLDDIEEFVTKEGNLQDQRLFKFIPYSISLKEETDNRNYNNLDERTLSRSSHKIRRAGGKRSRRKSMSQENVPDLECAIYYGELSRGPADWKEKSKIPRKRRSNSLVKESGNSTRAPYSRAMTMPTQRGNESPTDNIFRSKSFPLEHPRDRQHIHPKLPDYDELAAKFMELKRAHLKIKQQDSDINEFSGPGSVCIKFM